MESIARNTAFLPTRAYSPAICRAKALTEEAAWTGPARIAPPAVPEGRVLGAPVQPSVRSNILMAHLGTVGPNMTLLEALQSRQATDALRAMDQAREPARPIDICLQVICLSSDPAQHCNRTVCTHHVFSSC